VPSYDEVQYIHVARDGRDAAMSLHNHFKNVLPSHYERLDRIGMEDPAIGRRHPRPSSDPVAFFRSWLTTPTIEGQSDGSPQLSFFDLEAGYWAERRRSNLLLVHYNDLLRNLDGEMRRIANFLEIEVVDARWSSLVTAAQFNNMKIAGDKLMPQLKTFLGGSENFFHRGSNGLWRDVFTHDDIVAYATKVREKLSPGLAAWLSDGRLIAGDPVASAD
jgi:aryl sulfotransferase